MSCRHCGEELNAGCTCPPCRFCERPASECLERVDERFPMRAREAYDLAELQFAPRCSRGMANDLKMTRFGRDMGWCLDRAVLDVLWKGPPPEGMGPMFYAQLERTKHRRGASARRLA